MGLKFLKGSIYFPPFHTLFAFTVCITYNVGNYFASTVPASRVFRIMFHVKYSQFIKMAFIFNNATGIICLREFLLPHITLFNYSTT